MKNLKTYIIASNLFINNLFVYSVSQYLFDPLTVLVDQKEVLNIDYNNIELLTKNIKNVTSFNYNNNPFKLIHLKFFEKQSVLINKELLPQDLIDQINEINDTLNKEEKQIKTESNKVLSEKDSFKDLSLRIKELEERLISDFENNGLDILAKTVKTSFLLATNIFIANEGIENKTEINNVLEKYIEYLFSHHKYYEGRLDKYYRSGVPIDDLAEDLKTWRKENLSNY